MKLFYMLNSEQEVLNSLSLYALVLNCCSKGQVVKASRISCWRSHELFSEAGEPEQHLSSTQILLLWLGKFTWNSPQFKKKTGKMFQLLLLCQRYQFSSCSRVKECGHESSSCRHKLSWLQSQEAVNIIMWWTGWSRSVGWLLRYNGPQNTWHDDFLPFDVLSICWYKLPLCLCWAVSLPVCAWQRYRAEQFGYCAWRCSEMARNERNEEKSLQWNSANCFPLYLWPSWTATCGSESRKAPLWSLSRGEAVFLGGLFPRL